jgi:hypothetical protein
MLRNFFFGISIFFAVFIGSMISQSGEFRIERSILINSNQEEIFDYISDFHNFINWSPYEVDDSLQRTYSGNAKGLGSIYEWSGKEMGSGKMEMIEIERPTLIKIKLDFSVPMEAHNIAEYKIIKENDSIKVSWIMYGKNNFISKIFSTFIDIDKMVGGDFETGLQNMKKQLETK